MSPKEKFNPELHEENPEWTREDFAKSRRASELPREILSQFKNKGGRPRLENPKEAVKLRIDSDVLAAFRKTGPGWQTRMNAALRNALGKKSSRSVALRPRSAIAAKRKVR